MLECTHEEAVSAARELLGNLGTRLAALGAPRWWEQDPGAALPEATTLATPTGGWLVPRLWKECLAETALHNKGSPATIEFWRNSLLIPRPLNLPFKVAAPYLHTFLSSYKAWQSRQC